MLIDWEPFMGERHGVLVNLNYLREDLIWKFEKYLKIFFPYSLNIWPFYGALKKLISRVSIQLFYIFILSFMLK